MRDFSLSDEGITWFRKPRRGDHLADVISVCSWKRQHGLGYHCSRLRIALASERRFSMNRGDTVGRGRVGLDHIEGRIGHGIHRSSDGETSSGTTHGRDRRRG